MAVNYDQDYIQKLNKSIELYFPHLYKIEENMKITHEGVSRLVMLDRYAQKDINLKSLDEGDIVLVIVKDDPKFPARGIGKVIELDYKEQTASILVDEEFRGSLEDPKEIETGMIKRKLDSIDKPLEIYYEQIAKRVAFNLAKNEKSEEKRKEWTKKFYDELKQLNFVPAGRVLYGSGSNTEVTYFNCFVMPFIEDSRGGISDHRKQVMEIMSRGGGVGTSGSTLRPKNALAKGVGGKSSGAVSWLNDLSQLTHLVEQGGSRRGAQMIMLADWHPDILEFIISKMQNPRILQFLIEQLNDEDIIKLAKEKLRFVPLTDEEERMYSNIIEVADEYTPSPFSDSIVEKARKCLRDGGTYEVNNPEFLSGANISVTITKEFMEAVDNDGWYDLRFPDITHYTEEEKAFYDSQWHQVGDVREWEEMGYKVTTYKRIKAKELWNLINICATYSAEPGIFFIDNANDMTNAKGYNQKVVATNPCGEQPLSPYSVCNLAAVNLANMVNRNTGRVDWEKLRSTIQTGVRMQDNVIDSTPYFLEENKDQAIGERRIGMGVMGLHDLLIWCKERYGSASGNKLVDQLFEFIATTAYETSIELAKEKGSFPFLESKGSRDQFVQSGYIKRMPRFIKDGILTYGIRNSHLLTIAPTGSTGTMVGVSTGLEPYFAFTYYRSGRLGKFIEVNAKIVDEFLSLNTEYTKETLPDTFVSAMELKPEEHADVQCVIQRWIDSSISKTVNAPRNFTVTDVEAVYERLYKGGAKGGTVYVDGSRDAQVLTLKMDDKKEEQIDARELGLQVEESKHDSKQKNEADINPPRTKANKNIGVDIGDICPICLEGTVEEIGGCNTCTNCNAQLKCGL
ncbi:vitamin B12-dependent ribonucleotide reductase [Haloplasma contractile]|uniref:Vitamin B12-dependent ribonucleotide reductase n=1 Tax=Haloplasma contractile SSD-17B TaxID=1033810 RepID=U2FHV9_9MOLU|nr:vitamin B12-dependent ribonucleotide reductase [Haloplasma contractile]ERJ12410.1 ribonucleoside-diphosphate reductase alpha chain protein [Haloplasma contractile SSD-17B]